MALQLRKIDFEFKKTPAGALHFHWSRSIADSAGMSFDSGIDIRSIELYHKAIFGLTRSDRPFLVYMTKGIADAILRDEYETLEAPELKPIQGLIVPPRTYFGAQAHSDRTAFSLISAEGQEFDWADPLDPALSLNWLDPEEHMVLTSPMKHILASSPD